MMQWLLRLSTVAFYALLALTVAQAQLTPMPPPATLDKAARTAVVEAASRWLRVGYLFPDAGDKAARKIEDALISARYDSINEPAAFAARLTADMNAVAHDKHLRVFPPGDLPGSDEPPPPRNEECVVRSDRLSGNIGYIEVVCLPNPVPFRAALDRAMAPLADTKALIIDCRRNHGGIPQAEVYLAGYLLPKGAPPVVMDRFVVRREDTRTFSTMNFSTSPTPISFAGKPAYVLVSHETFSGGEALAYGLQARHMARIVGETTAGGGHSGRAVPLAAGFGIFLPTGRSDNPVTHSNWEGVGVKPDIKVPSADALKAVLQQLGQKPAAADIDTLSQARLFTPRTTPQPGSEAALRRMLGAHQSGHVDFSSFDEILTKLGAVESVSFHEVSDMGEDVYNVKCAHGSVKLAIRLGPDGKTVVDAIVYPLGPSGPPPEK